MSDPVENKIQKAEASFRDAIFRDAILDEEHDNADASELTVGQYWPNDTGDLDLDSRRALLHLIKGPLLTADRNKELWQALVNHQKSIRSRLADLFLELVIDYDSGIAFVRNVSTEDTKVPKAVKSQPLTLIDSIMILSLRKELLIDSFNRVFMGREEMIEQLAHYRPIARLDESAFRKRLEVSWSRLVKAGILQPVESEERCEISPVLKLIFGVEEVKAVNAEFEFLLREAQSQGADADRSDEKVVAEHDHDDAFDEAEEE